MREGRKRAAANMLPKVRRISLGYDYVNLAMEFVINIKLMLKISCGICSVCNVMFKKTFFNTYFETFQSLRLFEILSRMFHIFCVLEYIAKSFIHIQIITPSCGPEVI